MSRATSPGPEAMYTSKTSEWYTPPEIIEAVLALFGGTIDLDPCSNSKTDPNVPAREHFTQEDDGLSHAWHGRVYMNPPYGRGIAPWISKVREEYEAGRVQEAVVLVKSATDTAWFRILSEKYPRCEVAGRLHFSGCSDAAPFSSTIFYLGERVQRFVEVFGGIGVIVAPWPAAIRPEEAQQFREEALPPICETDSTRCGSFLTSDGPCARFGRRGCPFRRQAAQGAGI